jgi:multimeric flavodoxin WrbA
MQAVRILGVVGSPRKNGNTAKVMQAALEGASSVKGVEIDLYQMAGKEFHHCIGCFKCLDTGACVFKDDFQDFANRYMAADGVILGSPIYHMSVPGSMKAALDRLGNVLFCSFVTRGYEIPRLSKVCGSLTVGAARHGGQEMVMVFLNNSALLMNGVAVAGDSLLGSYIGAGNYLGQPTTEQPMNKSDRLRSRDIVLEDREGLVAAVNLGKRVAEMAKIVQAGKQALADELPSEYFFPWEDM